MILNKVLVLSVSAGEGHMRAAAAIKEEIRQRNPAAEVTVLDTFRYASPLIEKVVLGTYMEIIKMSPVIYGYLYRQAEKEKPLSGFAKQEFNRVLNRLAAPKLISFIEQMQPQAVVCTHPFPLGILSHLRTKGKCNMPIIAAITDFTVHPFWLFREVDCYLVAAPQLIKSFIDYGIDAAKVKATGIPIDPRFAVPKDRNLLRQQWGLAAHLPAILIMGGGLGMGPLAEVVKELAAVRLPCQLVVVCGRNETLRSKLLKAAPGLPTKVHVWGYLNNIHDLMAACDLMIGKAGGLTSSEAMASNLPMLITDPIPGQEERNAEFLESVGAARLVRGYHDLVRQVQNYLNHPAVQRAMIEAAGSIGCPRSAAAAADAIEELVFHK
ncbi:MGDG synthase family glycosyltransferase [Desulforamulus hydrothermalis]|uniref:Monogalactosyldiacylglycerol synthase n=1 Tax=Desulforamulus hydrothermalis Lam5 = DSM 18033 TaxID=1121428 RepID=K8ECM1_9FIRM|nr:glycosyltransferase [Desulforamulus hydrothermalis]CCO09433.1 Monogalactosyldiacylglycerol synthase [Desulforamulus hydrothermalis Lam5 = DSM 18033]SHH08255.1 processive 1,2-diacylglycerol beta-glucosyltransferase [Desulforamulus hydrothermalis Lam5 = DSM 18033]